MIHPKSYTPDWIASKREKYSKSDPAIMEKVIYALSLVEQLAESKLNFVFKGGTSLLLILPEPKRFSIDIDIVTQETRETIEAVLADICTKGIFTKFTLDEKRSYQPGIPKAHYLLTFFSRWENIEKVILLDILFEEHGYPALIQAPITNEWIDTTGNIVTVNIPSVDSITGDKLTAFAPNTIGVRYGRGKQMEIIKQLFDLGILFDRINNLDHFRQSFGKTSEKEIGYRSEEKLIRENVLHDIIETSLMIASTGKFFSTTEKYTEITDGITQIKSFIYNGAFRIDEAILASSKASYLATILLTGYEGEILRWQEGDDITKFYVKSLGLNFLNKKRNIPGGALFYWFKTLELLEASGLLHKYTAMTIEKMREFIKANLIIHSPYCVKATFKDGRFIAGFLVNFDDAFELEKENKFRFVKNPDSVAYHADPSDKGNSVILDLSELSSLELVKI